MTEITPDAMQAFEQTRVADLAAFYRALAALSEATTLDNVLAQEPPLRGRLDALSPSLISQSEEQALRRLLQGMIDSCVRALGH